MPYGTWNYEFRDAAARCNYPLADDATGVDDTGTFRLPTDFLVGLDLSVSAGADVDPGAFFLLSLGSFAGGYTLTFGHDAAGGTQVVATAAVPRAGFARNAVFPLGGLAPFGDTRGYVMVGALDGVDAQPPGLFTFTPAAGRLDPDAIRPMLRGVSALYLQNGADLVGPIRDDVVLRAGANFQWDVEFSGGTATVTANAISGAGTVTACGCDGPLASLPPITRINGVASAGGDFTLSGDDCYRITATPGGLKLEDTCSAPCCSCAELEAVTRDLERYRLNQDTLGRVVTELESSTRQTELVVLGARLGDRGCGSNS